MGFAMHLKAKAPDEDYPSSVCAVSRCNAPAMLDDATGKLAPGRVPLCEAHWLQRTEEDDRPVQPLPAPSPPPPSSDDLVLPGQLSLPWS
jgi:hypothetical protein